MQTTVHIFFMDIFIVYNIIDTCLYNAILYIFMCLFLYTVYCVCLNFLDTRCVILMNNSNVSSVIFLTSSMNLKENSKIMLVTL